MSTNQVALEYCEGGDNLDRVQDLVQLFRDALFHIPASSIAVEKLHANTQQQCVGLKAAKSAQHIQENSYVMSTMLEHGKVKSEVEAEAFGPKGKQRTARRLLHARTYSRTTAAKVSSKFSQKGTKTQTPD